MVAVGAPPAEVSGLIARILTRGSVEELWVSGGGGADEVADAWAAGKLGAVAGPFKTPEDIGAMGGWT